MPRDPRLTSDMLDFGTEYPHEDHVINEKQELDEKLKQLLIFSFSRVFQMMTDEDRNLINEQRSVMTVYSEILRKRIARFPMYQNLSEY